jgi:hypothetical protein
LSTDDDGTVTGTHTTPVNHYVDDLKFTFTTEDSGCSVKVIYFSSFITFSSDTGCGEHWFHFLQ